MGRVRRIEDAYSNPDILAAQHRTGRSAFFEIQLVLADYAERVSAASGGGLQGSPTFIEAQGGYGGGGEEGGGGGPLLD